MPPEKIGRYEIKAELGRGGMATVYRAYDPSFEREVAIKVLPREFLHDPQFRDRFKREIKTIAALEHPAIVPVYDVGEDDGLPYFVMRYMTGGSLSNWIEKGKFSMPDAARIIERLASALAYAHKKGVVHRDLKPDNILFDGNGDPFVSDFGVAKFSETTTNLTGSGIIGTPAYMSPEQAQGESIDNRSDIYGLGVIIFQMLSGKQPYNADTPMGVVVKHITAPVPEILKVSPGLPQETDAIIKTAMAKNRDERYPSALDLARALNSAAYGKEGAATPSATKAGSQKHEGRRTSAPAASSNSKRGIIFGGIAVVVILLLGGFLFRNQLFAPAQPAPTATATAAEQPVVPSAQPIEQAFTPTTSVSLAPYCQPDTMQVPVPVVNETARQCVRKVPYTTVSIPLEATFESLSDDMTCEVAETRSDLILVACTGKELISEDLKVCNPKPVPSTSAAGQCPENASYDDANKCCLKPAAEDAGCTVFEVPMRGCS